MSLILVSLACMTAPAGSAEPQHSPGKPEFKPAVLASPFPLRNPGPGGEALVLMRVTVGEKGKVTAVEVLDSSFGSKQRIDAAVSAARRFEFQPATLDGKAIAVDHIIPMKFTLPENAQRNTSWATTANPRFQKKLEKLDMLLDQREFDAAKVHAASLMHDAEGRGRDYAQLKATLAWGYHRNGRELQALQAAADATLQAEPGMYKSFLFEPIQQRSLTEYPLPEEATLALIGMRMELAASNGLLPEAMLAFRELASLGKVEPQDPRIALANRLVAKLEGSDALLAKVYIDGRSWAHPLFRRGFTLEKVRGEIHSLQVLCVEGVHELRYVPGELWTTPTSAGRCSVRIKGAAGTSFDFIELAAQPEPAAPQ